MLREGWINIRLSDVKEKENNIDILLYQIYLPNIYKIV